MSVDIGLNIRIEDEKVEAKVAVSSGGYNPASPVSQTASFDELELAQRVLKRTVHFAKGIEQ